MSKVASILKFLLPLMAASCVHERPSDLRLEGAYVADISATPGYKAGVAMGMLPQPLRLAIKLSSTETFPLGASVVDGFCGGKQGPGYLGGGHLYKATAPNGESSSMSSIYDKPNRHRYLVFVAIVYKPARPSPELANFDLRDDNHDICLTTGSGTYADVWRSNEVRVPRSLIEKALHEPSHARFPLSPNQLP